jgi:long-chain fatty acid transport protein
MGEAMRKFLVVAWVLALFAGSAWAGGIELDEQSARAVGTVGAQTAVADDPSAIFYNPAGLAFQKGLGLQANGNLIDAITNVRTPGLTPISHISLQPSAYAALRLGSHFAVGIGAFSNMAEHFSYPRDWPGRFLGTLIDVTTITINPSLAWRPLKHLAIGVGFDVVPAMLELRQGINFGGGEGDVHVGANAVGFGGNVGLLVDLVPNWLRFGFSYRSRIDLDFDGHGAVTAPPELQAMTGGLQIASTTLPLPHNFAFALAAFPARHLILSTDVRLTLWRDLSSLSLKLVDPAAPPGTAPTEQQLLLSLHNSWTIRIAGEYGFLDGMLHVRLGIGYDATPLPASTLGPLLPDADRVLVSGGIGVHWRWLDIDAAYLAAILLDRTATNPDLQASYQSMGHVISLGATIRLEKIGQIRNPEYR